MAFATIILFINIICQGYYLKLLGLDGVGFETKKMYNRCSFWSNKIIKHNSLHIFTTIRNSKFHYLITVVGDELADQIIRNGSFKFIYRAKGCNDSWCYSFILFKLQSEINPSDVCSFFFLIKFPIFLQYGVWTVKFMIKTYTKRIIFTHIIWPVWLWGFNSTIF